MMVTGEIPNGHVVSYYHEDPEARQYEGNLSPLTSHLSPLTPHPLPLTSHITQETGKLVNKPGQGNSST